MKKRILSFALVLTLLITTIFSFNVTFVGAASATSGTCGDNATWTYNTSTGTLTISGTGGIKNYGTTSLNRAPWYDHKPNIQSVIIGEGITVIGTLAFYNCVKLAAVSLPSTLTKITGGTANYGAFRECTALTNITLPEGLVEIDDMAFRGCSALTSITIPNSVTTLGSSAFRDCTNLTTVTFGTGLTATGLETFRDSGVRNVNFSSTITQITSYSFFNTRITSIEIPEQITAIGTRAFADCQHITSVTVHNPNCEFQGIIGEDPFNNGNAQVLTFYGHTGSTTQTYAETKGYNFVSIDPCDHENTSEVVTLAPTCTETGIATTICGNCGFAVSQRTLEATKHNWTVTEQHDATEEDGHIYTSYECANCSDTKEEIEHKAWIDGYYNYENTATCSRPGLETYTCNLEGCGKVQRNVAPSHDIAQWTVTLEPTCTVAGSQQGYCSKCEKTITKEIPALGHQNEYSYDIDNTEEDGHTYIVNECQVCHEETLVPTHVEWVEGYYDSRVLTNPKCVVNGTRGDTCTIEGCREYRVEQIPATGAHDWYETTRTQPTCSAKGTIYYACANEGCNLTKTESIEALGHDYLLDENNSVAATCTSAGYETYKCQRCASSKRDVINALGHTPDQDIYEVLKEPNCTEKGLAASICTVCQVEYEIVLDELGHNYEDVITTIPEEPGHSMITPTCTRCGTTKTGSKGHSEWYEGDYTTRVVTAGSCTIARVTIDTCNYCGQTRTNTTEAPGHNYSYSGVNADGYLTYTCANCDNVNAVNPNIVLATWNMLYMNSNPAELPMGYMFELYPDGIINIKDYVILSKAAKAFDKNKTRL